MKVYLLRHGETDYNAQQRYQGNGGGFVLDASRWREARQLFVIEQVQYTRKEDANVQGELDAVSKG